MKLQIAVSLYLKNRGTKLKDKINVFSLLDCKDSFYFPVKFSVSNLIDNTIFYG